MGQDDETDEGPDSGWTGIVLTPEQHACLSRVPEEPPTVVTLAPEYCVDVPLWPLGDATDNLVPPALLEKLMAWQALFDNNCHHKTGWLSEDAKSRWAEEAVGLEAELRAALAGKAEVVVDLWPLKPDETPDDNPA
jgi:hypothetical protein